MNDIAKACEVSRATVNRAINNSPNIKPETKEKIMNLISQVGYVPNKQAQDLVIGKSRSIGLILHNMSTEFSNMIYNRTKDICDEKGYYLHFSSSSDNPFDEETNINALLEYNVDGLIIFPINKNPKMLERVLSKDIPVVQIFNKLESLNASGVYVNEYEVIKKVVNHLFSKGHKRLAYVDMRYGKFRHQNQTDIHFNTFVNDERKRAFRDALNEAGVVNEYQDIHTVFQYGEKNGIYDDKKFYDIIKSKDVATGVICFDDYTSLLLMYLLRINGIRVPEDVSIIGHDDLDILRFIEPRMATVREPIEEVVKAAMRILFEQIEEDKKEIEEICFDAEFLDGKSVIQI